MLRSLVGSEMCIRDRINACTESQISIISYTSLTSSLSKLFHVIMRDEGIYLNLEYTPTVKHSCIKSFFIINCKGNSKIYKMIRKKYMEDNSIPIAQAYGCLLYTSPSPRDS